MNTERRLRQIITNMADAAYMAADGVTDAVQTASHVVGEKYDVIKINMEIARLQNEQNRLFESIGFTLYTMQANSKQEPAEADAETTADTISAQQAIERLILLAEQKQLEIDIATEKLQALNGVEACPKCGTPADIDAVYCSACGNKLLNR